MKVQRVFCGVLVGMLTSAALGSGASRDLPDSVLPGASFTVTILLDTPPGTSVAAAEDTPPAGWSVSNISNSGTFDTQTGKVKWGLFFAPSIPTTFSYRLTANASVSPCFTGLVSFDGIDALIVGDSCTVAIPTVSTWGTLTMSLVMAIAGTVIKRTRIQTEEEGFEPP